MSDYDNNSPVRTKPWNFGLHSLDEIGDLEKRYVLDVLDKKRLFRFAGGREQSEAYKLEQVYQDRLGVRHCLGLNSGTSALISALIGAGIGPGDEVIVPAYTYIATAAAVLIARAVPVIVEVDESMTIDPNALEAAITPYTKAVIPVHMRGIPCQMDEIMAIANKHHLIVIEDVAQANGGSYKGKPLGSIGHAGCFSFQQYKIITAGEGGLVATNDKSIYTRANMYHDSAFIYWDADMLGDCDPFPGENYRLCELNAALALAQTERLDSIITRLQRIKRKISEGIRQAPHIQLQKVADPAGDVSYSLIFYLSDYDKTRMFSDMLRREGIPNGTLNNKGFADRHIYSNWTYILNKRGVSEKDNPWNCESYKGNVQYSPDMCPRTLNLLGRAIAITLHQNMNDEDCDDIVRAILKVAAQYSVHDQGG